VVEEKPGAPVRLEVFVHRVTLDGLGCTPVTRSLEPLASRA
jgi:hypothetical protein